MRGWIPLVLLVSVAGCDALFGLDDLHAGPYFDAPPPDRDRVIDDGKRDARLIARFDFEDSFADSVSGESAMCVSTTGTCPTFTTGLHGKALQLDGVDDCLQFMLPTNPTHFTIAARINRDTDVPETAVAKPFGSGPFDTWQIDTDMVNVLHYVTYDGSTVKDLQFDNVVEPGAWLHVAVTFDGGSKVAFINGAALPTVGIGEQVVSDGSAMLIGCDSNAAQYGRMFGGKIDEVVVYDEELGPPEIAALAAQ